MERSVSIIGSEGFVGKAMRKLFPNALTYDIRTSAEGDKDLASNVDVAFVCVQTPSKEDGSLDTSRVEEVVSWCRASLIIVRSTLNPGTVDFLEEKYGKDIVHVPEYVGETVAHPLLDEASRPFLIIGGRPKARRKAIEIFHMVYNANLDIRQTTAREAEVIKLSENRAIFFKVMMCQELFDACEADGTDYYVIREAVFGDDPRFSLWFSFVYPNKRGANSPCIPKDVYAWAAWAESVGYKPELTNKMLEVNEKYIKNSNN